MALAAVLKNIDYSRRRKRFKLAVTMSGNYATGGDTLDLTAVTNPNFLPAGKFAIVPDDYDAQNAPGGYTAEFLPGTTLANGKVLFRSAAGAEVAAAAYPGALSGDTLNLTLSSKLYRS